MSNAHEIQSSDKAIESQAAGAAIKTAPAAIATQTSRPDNTRRQNFEGTYKPQFFYDAVSAQAAVEQARDADSQIVIGWAQAGGLVLSLFFSALATRAAFKAVREAEKGAQASKDSLEEMRRMNAATVRPHIAIEFAIIEIDQGTRNPVITLVIRNAGTYTAHDWEWQPLLKYRVHGGLMKESLCFSHGEIEESAA